MRRLTLFSLVLLTLIALLTVFAGLEVKLPLQPAQQANRPHGPDYFMTNFQLLRLDQEGKPAHTLSGQHLVDIPSRALIEVTAPHLLLHRDGEPDWQLKAQRAEIDRQEGRIRLLKRVTVERPADRAQQLSHLQLTTEALDLYPERHYAETDLPLTITRDQTTRISAVGLQADVESGSYQLLSQVHGYLEPNVGRE